MSKRSYSIRFFNPIHKVYVWGTLIIQAIADELIVIVNNDYQLALKSS